ncbi:MAG: hypothetical protein E6248_09720 [Clostridium sp.]|uniref:hypothetical protein n=1 Tax=Clostridium sp. TaxID=1506 RepID=UPI002911F263|nr:hypothetical protein [Clostridium sp.]MDU5110715.1 hypothetical protein [Clostridium sp.]
MKKHISLIGGLLISTILIGCSETKILDENTKDNISEKYTITERNIENTDKDKVFIPSFFDGDILYGTKMKDGSGNIKDYTMIYYLDSTDSIKNMEEGMLTNEEVDFIKGNGGYQDSGIIAQDASNSGEIKNYYINLVNKTIFELKDFGESKNKIQNNLIKFARSSGEISDNYHIIQYLSMDEDEINEARDFIIIDLKNEKYYINNNEKKVRNFYYDDSLDSIIAIDEIGKMYKLKFDENNITFEDYKTIKTDKVNLYDREPFLISNLSNNKLLLKIKNSDSKENMDYYNAIYDIETEEVIYFDKEKIIAGQLKNTKFYFISYKDEEYLGEVTENGNINLIYKLNNNDGYRFSYPLANKEGNKIFLTKIKISEESKKNPEKPIIKEDIKYSILEIQER